MKHVSILTIIVLFALVTRLINLGNPPAYYFDEVYHAVTAKAYALNNPAGYEWWHEAPEPGTAYEWLHPPMAKLLMAVGWNIFGRTPWAWRVPGAIAGTLLMLAIYWMSTILTKNKDIAVMAAGIASVDGLLLSMSRIGMNDIYVTLFMVLAVATYWKSRTKRSWWNRWLWLSGIFTGLAVGTKWSGVFVLGMVGVWELLVMLHLKQAFVKRMPGLFLIYVVIPALVYVGSYGQFWLQGHSWDQFKELHSQIWWYQTHLEATHDYQSQAWEWPLMLRPVWFWVKYYDSGEVANIYNLGNPFVFWFGLIALFWLFLKLVRQSQLVLPALVILVAYGFSWMPWLFSPRIMFSYHYTPAVPWLATALAFFINKLYRQKETRLFALGSLGLIAVAFAWLSPLWLGIPVSRDFLPYLFWLPSWK